jgi:hypothetical protein
MEIVKRGVEEVLQQNEEILGKIEDLEEIFERFEAEGDRRNMELRMELLRRNDRDRFFF